VIRQATSEDLDRIAAVCARALNLDPDAAQLPALLWDRSETRAWVAAENDTITGVLLGSVSGEVGHVDLFAVDPARRRIGIGAGLLAEFEANARAAGATQAMVGGSVDRYAWPGLDVRYTPALCLFEAAGYEVVNTATNMTVDLARDLDTAKAERRLAEDGIEVRRLEPGERAEFAGWMARWGGSWPQETARAAAHSPPRCHIAVRHDQYLGFACHGANRAGWFGPMGTDESTRGKGIGGVLLSRCLADQKAAGFAESQIGWVGPIAFYTRTLDAVIGRVFWLLGKSL
jgi:GNAT superfamily N-acetyltransferase